MEREDGRPLSYSRDFRKSSGRGVGGRDFPAGRNVIKLFPKQPPLPHPRTHYGIIAAGYSALASREEQLGVGGCGGEGQIPYEDLHGSAQRKDQEAPVL